jgi:hypothetical protein
MQTYYLQKDEDKRLFIDSDLHPGAELEKTVQAKSWIDAKREFGFHLSVAQLLILEEREAKEQRDFERMAA